MAIPSQKAFLEGKGNVRPVSNCAVEVTVRHDFLDGSGAGLLDSNCGYNPLMISTTDLDEWERRACMSEGEMATLVCRLVSAVRELQGALTDPNYAYAGGR